MKLFKKVFSNKYILLLTLLCSIIFVSHILYVTFTFQHPEWDEHKYMENSVWYYKIVNDSTINLGQKIMQVYNNFLHSQQPVYSLVNYLPLILFGTLYSYKIALLINVFFYIASIVGVFFLGKEFVNKKLALLAAIIFAFSGFPLFYLHFVYTETAATAFTILSLYFLYKSGNFKNKNNTLFFGLFFALGIATRWSFPVFITGPFLTILFSSLKSISKKERIAKIKNLLISAIIGFSPLIFWYLPNIKNFLSYVLANYSMGSSWVTPTLSNSFSAHSIIYYFTVFAQNTIWFYLLFLIGILICILKFKKYLFLSSAILIPYLFLTFAVTLKSDRFIVLAFPVIAIISTLPFYILEEKLKLKKIVNPLIIVTIILASLNFLGASWGLGPMKFSTDGNSTTLPSSVLIPMPLGHARRVWLTPISWPPTKNEGNVNLIVNTIKNNWKEKNMPIILRTFEMSQIQGKLYEINQYEDTFYINYNLLDLKKDDYKLFAEKLKTSDFVLIKNGIIDDQNSLGANPSYDKRVEFVRTFNNDFKNKKLTLPKQFKLITKISIPYDHSTLYVYKKVASY